MTSTVSSCVAPTAMQEAGGEGGGTKQVVRVEGRSRWWGCASEREGAARTLGLIYAHTMPQEHLGRMQLPLALEQGREVTYARARVHVALSK